MTTSYTQKSNKKAFQYDENQLFANHTLFIMNKILTWLGSLYSKFSCIGGGFFFSRVPCPERLGQGQVKPLYSYFSCLMGNGPMGHCPTMNRMTDRHDWKHYLATTSWIGGNNVGKFTSIKAFNIKETKTGMSKC